MHGLEANDPLAVISMIVFLTIVFVLPLAGYVFMVADYRSYLRSLKRGLVRVASSFTEFPVWARQYTPPSIAALGLQMPCTEEDLKQAYRERVKQFHPDHGGDQRRFLMLQAQFEEALAFLAEEHCEPVHSSV